MRDLRPFIDALPPHLAELAFMAHGMAEINGFFGHCAQIAAEYGAVLEPGTDPQTPEALENIAEFLEKEQCISLSEQIDGILDQFEVSAADAPLEHFENNFSKCSAPARWRPRRNEPANRALQAK